MNIDLELELQRSEPDYVLYKPRSVDGSTFDRENEHLLGSSGVCQSLFPGTVDSHRDHEGER